MGQSSVPHADICQQEAIYSAESEEMWHPIPRTGFHLHRLCVPCTGMRSPGLALTTDQAERLEHTHPWSEVLRVLLRVPRGSLCPQLVHPI